MSHCDTPGLYLPSTLQRVNLLHCSEMSMDSSSTLTTLAVCSSYLKFCSKLENLTTFKMDDRSYLNTLGFLQNLTTLHWCKPILQANMFSNVTTLQIQLAYSQKSFLPPNLTTLSIYPHSYGKLLNHPPSLQRLVLLDSKYPYQGPYNLRGCFDTIRQIMWDGIGRPISFRRLWTSSFFSFISMEQLTVSEMDLKSLCFYLTPDSTFQQLTHFQVMRTCKSPDSKPFIKQLFSVGHFPALVHLQLNLAGGDVHIPVCPPNLIDFKTNCEVHFCTGYNSTKLCKVGLKINEMNFCT
jgi:hypothetical protein